MSLNLLLFILFIDVNVAEEKLGGRKADKGEFPFVVSISWERSCSGTILTLKNIITAGQCMVNNEYVPVDVKKVTVIGGTTDSNGQKREVSNIWFHDGFLKKSDSVHYYNDVSMVELKSPFQKSETLSPAKLPSYNYNEFKELWSDVVSTKKSCFGLGWGAGKKKVSDLLAFELTPMERAKCKANVSSEDLDMTEFGEVCVESKEKEGICGADLGGPLFCNDHVYAIGISVLNCAVHKTQFFLLLAPYLDYFELTPPKKLNIRIDDGLRGGGCFISANRWVSFFSLMIYTKLSK